jgi:hypothetical protein
VGNELQLKSTLKSVLKPQASGITVNYTFNGRQLVNELMRAAIRIRGILINKQNLNAVTLHNNGSNSTVVRFNMLNYSFQRSTP